MLNEIVYWNIESAIGSFCRVLDCPWVNPWESVEMHKYKGYQLQLLNQAGIRVPETLITNDPDELIAFYERLNKQVIFKPVRGWAHTTLLKDEDLTSERLKTLANSPVKLQEFIPGTDIRAYLVGNEMFAMEIHSTTLDFREDDEAKRVPITLPDEVLTDCKRLADVLKLVFTGIDLRRTPEGEYVFFEGNPTPVFILDEQLSGYPISDRIIDLLVHGIPPRAY
jgi:glutathione synthase/RimK-type ligase-like ATP-grasp enzyme